MRRGRKKGSIQVSPLVAEFNPMIFKHRVQGFIVNYCDQNPRIEQKIPILREIRSNNAFVFN